MYISEHIGIFYYLKHSNEQLTGLLYSFLILTGFQSQKNILGVSKLCEEDKYFSGTLVVLMKWKLLRVILIVCDLQLQLLTRIKCV